MSYGHHTAEGNLEFIIDNLILLQDHYSGNNVQCSDCILKHLETIRAYAGEGLSLDNSKERMDELTDAYTLASDHMQKVIGCVGADGKCEIRNRDDINSMIQEARALRRKLNITLYGLAGDLLYGNERVMHGELADHEEREESHAHEAAIHSHTDGIEDHEHR